MTYCFAYIKYKKRKCRYKCYILSYPLYLNRISYMGDFWKNLVHFPCWLLFALMNWSEEQRSLDIRTLKFHHDAPIYSELRKGFNTAGDIPEHYTGLIPFACILNLLNYIGTSISKYVVEVVKAGTLKFLSYAFISMLIQYIIHVYIC